MNPSVASEESQITRESKGLKDRFPDVFEAPQCSQGRADLLVFESCFNISLHFNDVLPILE